MRRAIGLLRRIRWRRVLFDLAVVAAIVAAVGAWQARHLVHAGPAPALALPTLAGEEFDLAALRGEKVLVVFWAPWCGVCKLEMPTLTALAKDGVRVVGVALGHRDAGEVERFVRAHAPGFPILLGDERTARAWKVESFPTLYVIDEAGEIEHALVGYATGFGLRLRLLF